MAALNDAGARVVLIGTGKHAAGSGLEPVPAVERSVRDLAEVLVERCGLARERLRVVIDPANPTEIGEILLEEAKLATSVLLVYYVGHGLVGLSGGLYLATQSTKRRSGGYAFTSLAYNDVRDAILESPAASRVVVLDCCHSGRALGVLGSAEDEAADLTRVDGGFVLTSAARDELALAPEGDTYTAFTGEFLKLLRNGDPEGQQQLNLHGIYQYLARTLPARGIPRPRRTASDRAGDLVLAVNPAYKPPPLPPVHDPGDEDEFITVCPYPGLAAFEPDQAEWFFGRERLTTELTAKLASRLAEGGPLVVVAPSGTGKSSLLRAGLIPALADGKLSVPGSRRWPRVLMTPGPHPLTALAAQIAPRAGIDAATLAGDFALGPGPGVDHFRTVLHRQAEGRGITGARVVVIIDQFEEVFTLCTDETERRTFIELLGELASGTRETDPAGLVVLGLRADFYGRCAEYPELREAVQREQVLVGPMSATELREAIERPAQEVGMRLEPGLTELLLRDIGASDGDEAGAYEAGRLPLIAYALQQTWEHRSGRNLTVAGYQDTGGILNAISTAADKTYAALPEASQQATKPLFLRLVKIGDEGTQDTRRSVSRAELLSHSPTSAAVETALTGFTDARLLTSSQDSVEISHEALLRAWPRLQEWISSDRAGNLLGQQLEDAAITWERSGHDRSVLLRGSRLEVALGWARDRVEDGDVSPAVGSFLRESRRQQARAGRIRLAAVAVLAVVALVAASFAWYAVRQKSNAQASSRTAILNQVTAEADQLASTDPSLAAELNVLAYRMKPSDAIYTDLVSAQDIPLATVLPVPSGTPDSIAFSPNGGILAAAVGTGVQLWTVSPSSPPRPLGSLLSVRSGGADSIAFSPKGGILAAATGAGVQLWNVAAPAHPVTIGSPLPDRSGAVVSVAFSPSGDVLAAATSTGVQLWNVSSVARPVLIGTLQTSKAGPVSSVDFSPDGRTLAVGALSLQLWNVASPARPRVSATIPPLYYYSGHSSPFLSVAFSPDGRVLAAGAADAAVHLWGVANPARPVSFGYYGADTGNDTSVAFSPDGDLLASGSADTKAYLYNVTGAPDGNSWSPAYPALTGHTAAILAVDISPDGSTLATASADHTIRLWHLPRAVLIAHSGWVDGLALSPSGDILASGSADDTMRLWNVANPAAPTDLSGAIPASGQVNSISFSPEGRLLAAAEQNVVQLWQVTDPSHPTRIGPPLPGFGPDTRAFYVTSVAFSPNGRTLAVGSWNHTVQLWDVTDPAHLVPVGPPLPAIPAQGVGSVSFSPDGRTLAVGGNDGKIRLWDVADPAHPVLLGSPLTGNAGRIDAVAFSPNGQTLASGDAGGSVELWDVKDPTRASMLGQPLTGQTSNIYALAFAPDGHTLASGSLDGTIRLWNVGNPSSAHEIGGPLTGDTGGINSLVFGSGGNVLYAGDGSYAVRIWNLDPATAIQNICATTANVLTPAQWHQYVPELPYDPPCGASQ